MQQALRGSSLVPLGFVVEGVDHCGVCGGPCSLRGQDRYACSARVTNGSCANTRTITRGDLEQRVLAGLKDRMMAPEMAAEAMRAYERMRELEAREDHGCPWIQKPAKKDRGRDAHY
jgi:site-specific DNA recombinase